MILANGIWLVYVTRSLVLVVVWILDLPLHFTIFFSMIIIPIIINIIFITFIVTRVFEQEQ